MMNEFTPFPKIPRLNRPVVVTEKLDGTNAAVVITDLSENYGETGEAWGDAVVELSDGSRYAVTAQSRKRVITPGKGTDNAGFALWAHDNAEALALGLGPGIHFGEWWGQGIQHGYGLDEKRFSLFNVNRWSDSIADEDISVNKTYVGDRLYEAGVRTVPVLFEHELFDTTLIEADVEWLRAHGSVAVPGFDKPEGIIIYHTAGGYLFKRLLDNDEIPKGL